MYGDAQRLGSRLDLSRDFDVVTIAGGMVVQEATARLMVLIQMALLDRPL